MPMEEREIESDTDQVPSVPEVPAVNWAKYVVVKSTQYKKMGHAPMVKAEEPNDWVLRNVVRETQKNSSTDPNLLRLRQLMMPVSSRHSFSSVNNKIT